MDKETIEALESLIGEELDEDEIAAISKALDREDIQELESALSVFVEHEADFPDEAVEVISALSKLVEKLALKVDEQTREEEGGETKKVQKSPSWSFNLGSKRED